MVDCQSSPPSPRHEREVNHVNHRDLMVLSLFCLCHLCSLCMSTDSSLMVTLLRFEDRICCCDAVEFCRNYKLFQGTSIPFACVKGFGKLRKLENPETCYLVILLLCVFMTCVYCKFTLTLQLYNISKLYIYVF